MPCWLPFFGLVLDFCITQTHAMLVPSNEDELKFVSQEARWWLSSWSVPGGVRCGRFRDRHAPLRQVFPGAQDGCTEERLWKTQGQGTWNSEDLFPGKHLWNLCGPEGFMSPHPHAYPRACQSWGLLAWQTAEMCLLSFLEGGFVSYFFSVDYRQARDKWDVLSDS